MPLTLKNTAPQTTIYVIAASDHQVSGNPNENDATNLLSAQNAAAIMHKLNSSGIKVYGALFCGDYTQSHDAAKTANGIGQLEYYIEHNLGGLTGGDDAMIFVQGNHDLSATPGDSEGLSTGGAHDTASMF